MAGRRKGYGYRTGNASFIAPYQGTSVFFDDFDAYTGPFGPVDDFAKPTGDLRGRPLSDAR